jgi:hypothetical protein
MISSTTNIGAAALFTGVLLSSVMPASATLKTCHAMVDGLGRDPIAAIAFEKAKTNWRIHVEDAYGSHFADWSNAEIAVGIPIRRVGSTTSGPTRNLAPGPIGLAESTRSP